MQCTRVYVTRGSKVIARPLNPVQCTCKWRAYVARGFKGLIRCHLLVDEEVCGVRVTCTLSSCCEYVRVAGDDFSIGTSESGSYIHSVMSILN